MHIGHGGILGGLLSGAGVGNDLCRIEQELAATDAGAEGLQLATGHQVADGAVGHAEHEGSVSGGHEERARWRLRRGRRGGKNGGGGRHKKERLQRLNYSTGEQKSDAMGAGYDTISGKRGKMGKSGKIGKRGKSGSGGVTNAPGGAMLYANEAHSIANEQRKAHHH